jgi:hypothetical protein
MMTPKEILEYRAILHTEGNGGGIYDLYAENSEMKQLFGDISSFCTQFAVMAGEYTHAGLKVVRENIKGKFAEVNYIEYFAKEDKVVTFYSKARFVFESGKWRILREERENNEGKL